MCQAGVVAGLYASVSLRQLVDPNEEDAFHVGVRDCADRTWMFCFAAARSASAKTRPSLRRGVLVFYGV